MEKEVINIIEYIDSAVDKTGQFSDYSPKMSDRVLDNRIMTLEGYIRYIERETMPKLKVLAEKFEEVSNG